MTKNIFNTNIPIVDDTRNAAGYLYYNTDAHQNKIKDVYGQYLNHFKDFYNYLDSKNGSNLWNYRINTLPEYDPYLSEDPAMTNNLSLRQQIDFENNNGTNDETLMDLFYPAEAKTWDLLDEYDRLSNWDKIQAPTEFNDLATQAKQNVSQEILDSMDYMNQLYNSKRATKMMNRSNKFALRRGANQELTGFQDVDQIQLQSHDTGAFSHNSKGETPSSLKIGIAHENPSRVTAHELAHTRKLFNTRNTYQQKTDESKYYGNNYDYIKNKHKKWLAAVPDKNGNVANNHDSELSERYSDLMATRMEMNNAGINSGLNKRYTNKDIKNYMQTEIGQKDRFLQYSGNNFKNIRKALNRIYEIGGVLNKTK